VTIAVITAHGQQDRLKGVIDHPKQLLTLDGLPIAERTVRLCFEHGIPACNIYVIAPEIPAWIDFTDRLGINRPHALKWPGRPLLDGLFEARALFSELHDSIVLLGDVVFSRQAFRSIVLDEEPIRFYGRPGANTVTGKPNGEMFAWSFKKEITPLAMTLLSRALMQAPGRTMYGLYKYADRFSTFNNAYFKIEDYTDDVDDARDVSTLPLLAKAVKDELAATGRPSDA
jgi:hypothetical protein